MAYLRSGTNTKTTKDGNDNNVANDKVGGAGVLGDKKASGPSMTTIIFFGLLIDLLAFTLILPLFPALLDHYKKNDAGVGGLYHFLEERVKTFGHYLGAPDRFNTVLFGGLIGSLFSFLQGRNVPLFAKRLVLLLLLLKKT
jgi:hypothetical protein